MVLRFLKGFQELWGLGFRVYSMSRSRVRVGVSGRPLTEK